MAFDLPLSVLERFTNRVLAMDPYSLGQMAELEGRIIAIHVKQPDTSLFIIPGTKGLTLSARHENEPDVMLEGPLAGFLKLLTNKKGLGFSDAGVRINGDIEIAQKFKNIADDIQLDWEEELSKTVGDVAAHQIGRAGRGVFDWLKQTKTTLERNASEYLQEEAQVLAKHDHVERFMHNIDILRDDVDRLEARILNLTK